MSHPYSMQKIQDTYVVLYKGKMHTSMRVSHSDATLTLEMLNAAYQKGYKDASDAALEAIRSY